MDNQQAVDIKNVKKKSQTLAVMKRLLKSPAGMIGFCTFCFLVLIAIFAPYIAPYNYKAIDIANAHLAPSWAHPFGTDSVGRDIFSRLLVGTRYSLTIGLASTLLGTMVGIIFGSAAGYFGGTVDEILMRMLDVIQSVPGLALNIALACVIGSGFWQCVLVLSVSSVPGSARMIRAQMMRIRKEEYIEAAVITNCSPLKIIANHLFPNSFSPLLVQASMGVGAHITAASALAVLGLGVPVPSPEWGAMLSDGRNYITQYPWLCIFPGVCIAITVLAMNLLGDGLRDALDPKLKK